MSSVDDWRYFWIYFVGTDCTGYRYEEYVADSSINALEPGNHNIQAKLQDNKWEQQQRNRN